MKEKFAFEGNKSMSKEYIFSHVNKISIKTVKRKQRNHKVDDDDETKNLYKNFYHFIFTKKKLSLSFLYKFRSLSHLSSLYQNHHCYLTLLLVISAFLLHLNKFIVHPLKKDQFNQKDSDEPDSNQRPKDNF